MGTLSLPFANERKVTVVVDIAAVLVLRDFALRWDKRNISIYSFLFFKIFYPAKGPLLTATFHWDRGYSRARRSSFIRLAVFMMSHAAQDGGHWRVK